MRGLSLVVASGGHSSLRSAGLSLLRPLLLQGTGSRRAGSVVVALGPSCSAACGIFPDQGLNPCPLHGQADSQPLRHQGSPHVLIKPQRSLLYILLEVMVVNLLHIFITKKGHSKGPEQSLHKGEMIFATSIDAEKAFDKIQHLFMIKYSTN